VTKRDTTWHCSTPVSQTTPSSSAVANPDWSAVTLAKADGSALLLCAGLVVAAIAATFPVLEMGLNDDWSYAYIARHLAETGQLAYDGWASAMVGFQALFGALIIKTFGFSFTALRLSTSIYVVGCALLLFKISRASGLNQSFACLATLSVVLSPLFIPLAASFMTDVPALFFALACFSCAIRAVMAADTRSCVRWLTAAAVTGMLGGTVRQVVWGAPLSAIPAIVWIRRGERRVVMAGAFVFMACAAFVGLGFRWLARQPYFEWDPAPQHAGELVKVFAEPRRFAALMRTALLLMLPVLAPYFVGWWRTRRMKIVIPGVLVLLAAWAVTQFMSQGAGFPYGNLVTQYGVLNPGTEAIGSKPVVLSRALVDVLSLLTLAAAAACIVALCHGPVIKPSTSASRPALNAALIAAPFYAGYLFILLYRTRFGDLFDRYLILLLPAANLTLLWLYQHRIQERVPLVAWLVVGVFGVYGTAATHDYIAAARARLEAASVLAAAGVPRTRITAGVEFDGWTELETAGHINNFLIAIPEDAYRFRPFRQYPGGLRYLFWALTPSVDPEYFVVYSRQPGFIDSSYGPVTYSTWLPPSTRTVYTQVLASDR
jgi:dolichyl-phosphate-mannose-protein mannosyltransferase